MSAARPPTVALAHAASNRRWTIDLYLYYCFVFGLQTETSNPVLQIITIFVIEMRIITLCL